MILYTFNCLTNGHNWIFISWSETVLIRFHILSLFFFLAIILENPYFGLFIVSIVGFNNTICNTAQLCPLVLCLSTGPLDRLIWVHTSLDGWCSLPLYGHCFLSLHCFLSPDGCCCPLSVDALESQKQSTETTAPVVSKFLCYRDSSSARQSSVFLHRFLGDISVFCSEPWSYITYGSSSCPFTILLFIELECLSRFTRAHFPLILSIINKA